MAHGGSLTRSPGDAAISSIALREIGLKIQSLFAVSLFFLAWLRRRLWPLLPVPYKQPANTTNKLRPVRESYSPNDHFQVKSGGGGGRFRLSATRSTVERKTFFHDGSVVCGCVVLYMCGLYQSEKKKRKRTGSTGTEKESFSDRFTK